MRRIIPNRPIPATHPLTHSRGTHPQNRGRNQKWPKKLPRAHPVYTMRVPYALTHPLYWGHGSPCWHAQGRGQSTVRNACHDMQHTTPGCPSHGVRLLVMNNLSLTLANANQLSSPSQSGKPSSRVRSVPKLPTNLPSGDRHSVCKSPPPTSPKLGYCIFVTETPEQVFVHSHLQKVLELSFFFKRCIRHGAKHAPPAHVCKCLDRCSIHCLRPRALRR